MTPDDIAARARAILADLVAFDTTSHKSNLALIDYVEGVLHQAGARTERVPSPDGEKANLAGVLGPDAPGGVILSGHTDVVPVDGQPWSSDPWTLTERDGRLYGRGTCDMKGFIACALAAAPVFAQSALGRPVHFAFSYDEEVGCFGAPALIARLRERFPQAAAAIIGEPSEMKVVTGHKGLWAFDVRLEGFEAHSSLVEDGACAVTHAVPLMALMRDFGVKMRDQAPADSAFEPPFGTLTIGRMEGGTALNILARQASFGSFVRPAPWDDMAELETRLREEAAAVEAAMRRTAPNARVSVTLTASVPPMRPETDGAAERLARQLTGDNATHLVSYAAEAGQFQEAGFSTVICGPGSIAQAHQPDEFIALAELEKGTAFMLRLAQHLSTEPAGAAV